MVVPQRPMEPGVCHEVVRGDPSLHPSPLVRALARPALLPPLLAVLVWLKGHRIRSHCAAATVRRLCLSYLLPSLLERSLVRLTRLDRLGNPSLTLLRRYCFGVFFSGLEGEVAEGPMGNGVAPCAAGIPHLAWLSAAGLAS